MRALVECSQLLYNKAPKHTIVEMFRHAAALAGRTTFQHHHAFAQERLGNYLIQMGDVIGATPIIQAALQGALIIIFLFEACSWLLQGT